MTDPNTPGAERPTIGVFDSGFGGLTVLSALTKSLPNADFLYLGDTARLPYGSKSPETITRYTAAAIRFLSARGAELVVIACNTASALALPSLEQTSPVPLVGVIQPGAHAAAAAIQTAAAIRTAAAIQTQSAAHPIPAAPTKTSPPNTTVLVLATEATVASHAYSAACANLGLHTFEKACPLLVPMVEEGWADHPVTAEIATIYLREALTQMQAASDPTGPPLNATSPQFGRPAAILLGCTHYPLLRGLIERLASEILTPFAVPVPIVDSAAATAAATATQLCSLLPNAASAAGPPPSISFFATDSPAKFQHLGERFLQQKIKAVKLIDLDAPEPSQHHAPTP